MKKLTIEELDKIITSHKLWLDTKGEEGEKADLEGVDLRGAILQEANLSEANLQGADLQWADLRKANLQEADLRGADLRGADLRGADLQGADLEEAILRKADLQEADLRGANLRGADLRWTDLREANLNNVDLSKIKSLWNCAGDGKKIKNIYLNSIRYDICYTSNLLQIGCKLFLISEWEKFSDEKILTFDERNPQEGLEWWKENKDEIFQTIKEDPAE